MIYATHKNWREEVLRTEIGPRGQKIGWKKQLEDEQAEECRTAIAKERTAR